MDSEGRIPGICRQPGPEQIFLPAHQRKITEKLAKNQREISEKLAKNHRQMSLPKLLTCENY
jgi:hypothetical protein